MRRYAESETSFALLSIRPSRRSLLEAELEELQARLDSLTISGTPESSPDAEQLRMEILSVRNKLEDEQNHLERQRRENVRRRHNYVPFIMTLLKHLSRKGKLQGLIDEAKRKKQAQQASRPAGGN